MKVANIQTFNLDWSDDSFVPESFYKDYHGFAVLNGDIVFALTRPIISTGLKAAIADVGDELVLLNQRNAIFRPKNNLDKHFFYHVLFSDSFRTDFGNGKGTWYLFRLRVVNVMVSDNAKQSQLDAAIAPVADRLLKRFNAAKSEYQLATEEKREAEAKAAKDTIEALILFRTDIATYVRAYTFLSQIFDYGNTDFEKRAIFYKLLGRLLKFGREREGVDLSEVRLTHHKLRKVGQRNLGLSDQDAPKLNPMTEAGSGMVREKQKAYLTEIIEQLNTLFGSDTTEGDQLSYATTLAEKTLESELLQKQAANNSKEQFANSPDLTSEILNAVMDSMDAQMELSGKALNSADIREGLKRILLNQLGLYEKLRQRATGWPLRASAVTRCH